MDHYSQHLNGVLGSISSVIKGMTMELVHSSVLFFWQALVKKTQFCNNWGLRSMI